MRARVKGGTPEELEIPLTRQNKPDMRLKAARHDPALVVAQALEDAVVGIFRDLGREGLEQQADELEEDFPGGLEGSTTGRADMRLAQARHDPKLVAMQEVLDRVQKLQIQIAINKDIVEGEKAPLPTIRDLFESEFLDGGDLAGVVEERVPTYEVVRKAHEKYRATKAPEPVPPAQEETTQPAKAEPSPQPQPKARGRVLTSPGRRKAA